MADNVTPFRPRRPTPKPTQRGGGLSSHRGKAVLVHALTLAAFGLSLLLVLPSPFNLIAIAVGIGAFLIAYTNRAEAMPWAQTHHEHALRTLMIGYAIWIIASLLLSLFGPLAVAIPFVRFGVLIWVAVRAGAGLVLAILRKPIPHPRGVLL